MGLLPAIIWQGQVMQVALLEQTVRKHVEGATVLRLGSALRRHWRLW